MNKTDIVFNCFRFQQKYSQNHYCGCDLRDNFEFLENSNVLYNLIHEEY